MRHPPNPHDLGLHKARKAAVDCVAHLRMLAHKATQRTVVLRDLVRSVRLHEHGHEPPLAQEIPHRLQALLAVVLHYAWPIPGDPPVRHLVPDLPEGPAVPLPQGLQKGEHEGVVGLQEEHLCVR